MLKYTLYVITLIRHGWIISSGTIITSITVFINFEKSQIKIDLQYLEMKL